MPIYEYRCCDCSLMFEKLVRGKDTGVVCPDCGSESTIKLISHFSYGIAGSPGSTTSKSSCSSCSSHSCHHCNH